MKSHTPSDETHTNWNPSIPSEGSAMPAPANPESPMATSSEPKAKKQKTKTSAAWENFKVINKVNYLGVSEVRAECIHCKKDYAFDSHKSGTTSLNRHMLACLRTPRNGDIGDMIVNHEGRLQSKKIDQTVFRGMISKCIIEHDLPFSFVEYDRVRMLWSYLNADVKFISRNTAASDVYKVYQIEKAKLMIELSEIPGRISFTSDLWTAITVEGYICLTAHYVDKNWQLKNKILSFCTLPPPHTGLDLAMKIGELWKEWGIERKVFSITLDNATNNDVMQNILRKQLVIQKDLLCNGEFFHIRCSVHVLNLIVHKGLKVIGNSLYKIRESIKFVQASESRGKLFAKCVESVGIHLRAGLAMDVPTRWNSTFKMLDRAIKYRSAFESYQGMDRNYKFLPTEEEWDLGIQVCELLQPFDEITNLISGSTYPTSNLYFMQVYYIEHWLKLHEDNVHPVISEMVKDMKAQFDKYWHDYSEILAMAVVLDPRFKLSLLEYCFFKLDESTCEQKVENVKNKLKLLYEAYKSTPKPTTTSFSASQQNREEVSDSSSQSEKKSFINYDDFNSFRKKKVIGSGKSSLDMYLEEPDMDGTMFTNLNVLDYWKNNALRFGDLATMACDLLSIPITTVAAESSFSIGSRVLSKYRSCLLPKNVQALLCTRNWIRGFNASENGDVENVVCDEKEAESSSKNVEGDGADCLPNHEA